MDLETEDEDSIILHKMQEKKRRKSFSQLINKRKLSGFELDDLFVEE